MSLPNSWVMTPLSNLLDRIVGGGTPSKSIAANFIGKVPFMTVKDMKARFITDTVDHISEDAVSSSATTKIPADTLVVATRMSLGKIVRPSSEVAINQDLKALFPFAGVNKTYIEYFWRSKSDFIQSIGTGTTVKGIRIEDIKNLEVPLAPEIEQRRIAEKLDTTLVRVDALNDRLARITPLLKRFRQSVLAAATSGRLSDDNWLPKFELLGNVCLKVTDGEHSTPKRESDGRYLISARNIRDGYIDLSKVDYVGESEFFKLRQRCDPQIGDVLLSCSGSVGRVALVDCNNCYVMVRSAALIRPNSEILDSKYLMFVLQSPLLQEQIENSSKSTAQANIFLGPIKKLNIPLVNIFIQKQIVRRVETLFAFADRLEARLQSAQTAAERLTPALLAKAFRGELVPQDPNDEPATELLRRLREARMAEVSTKPKRGRKISP